jgi:hypothetical protein
MLARRPLRSKQNMYTPSKGNLLTLNSNIKTLSGASKPVAELTVEDHAAYYANSKPPSRKYPNNMASDLLLRVLESLQRRRSVLLREGSRSFRRECSLWLL